MSKPSASVSMLSPFSSYFFFFFFLLLLPAGSIRGIIHDARGGSVRASPLQASRRGRPTVPGCDVPRRSSSGELVLVVAIILGGGRTWERWRLMLKVGLLECWVKGGAIAVWAWLEAENLWFEVYLFK
ncbi:hypothetical protein CC78DRAFT_57422 [Lojkania enalia]|uniref:Uncharacterized protein n=1 Tax=Lojkania enalia TaxID=147567 RepID=A0A9P4JZV7_9PLEO|nr:hypothetical protein CC78DRAFT_57422 [Didymosphaeria enalia]